MPQENDRTIRHQWIANCALFLFTLLTCSLSIITLIYATRTQQNTHAENNDTISQPQYVPPFQHIDVIGDGRRFIRTGYPLSHWKVSNRIGDIHLQYHTYIIIRFVGLYHIYGHISIYGKHKPPINPIHVSLMINNTIRSTIFVDGCAQMCSRTFVNTVPLSQGDRIWLKSAGNGTLKLSSEHSSFGVTLIKNL